MNALIIITISFTIILMFALLFRHRGTQEGQMVATTLGILGTFFGIAYGLYYFDTTNISAAVPQLLDGLRTAFYTSIAGMLASLFIGTFPQKLGFESAEQTGSESLSERDLLAGMYSEMQQLNANIAGENETTLITQVHKLRISVTDKQDELKQSFDAFAQQMAENNTKALIEAVQRVMDDFSTKINDQLGENFARLGNAAENLVTWQDQYKDQLAVAAETLEQASKSIDTSTDALSSFTEQAGDFKHISEELKETLDAMGGSMTGFKNLATTLEDSGKQIRNEMSEITKDNIKELGENLKGLSEKLVEDYSYLQKMMQTATNQQDK